MTRKQDSDHQVPEVWLDPRDALAALRTCLACSEGHAEALLRKAMASGEVRLRTRDLIILDDLKHAVWVSERCPAISEGADMPPGIQINAPDIEAWVNSEPTPVRPSVRRVGYKAELARQVAAAIWGAHGPPEGLPPQQIFKLVADKAQELYGVTISKNQVLRAVAGKSA